MKNFSPKAEILVDAALNKVKTDFALVNSLKTELKKQILFAKHRIDNEYDLLLAQLGRLPKGKSIKERCLYMSWTSFQLWMLQTLKNAGVDPAPSKHVLESFERMATPQEKNKLKAILG